MRMWPAATALVALGGAPSPRPPARRRRRWSGSRPGRTAPATSTASPASSGSTASTPPRSSRRRRSPTPASRPSTTASPKSPSCSPPTRSCRARTSSRCAMTGASSATITSCRSPPQPAASLRPAAAPPPRHRVAAALDAGAARPQPAGHRRAHPRGGRWRVRRLQRARRPERGAGATAADPVGYQAFDENQTLAHLYAQALRGAGYRVASGRVGGLRPAAVSAMRHHRIDLWPGWRGPAASGG